jgi:hypothetical protein
MDLSWQFAYVFLQKRPKPEMAFPGLKDPRNKLVSNGLGLGVVCNVNIEYKVKEGKGEEIGNYPGNPTLF